MKQFLNVMAVLLVDAEQIVPIFIHNPQSQKVEAVIATTANNTIGVLLQMMSQPAAAPAAPAPAPAEAAS